MAPVPTATRFVPISGPGQTWGVYAPALAPSGGTFSAPQTVTSSTPTPGATLRYTTTGMDPLATDPTWPSGGLTLADPTTLKVRGFKTGMTPSPVTTGLYAFAANPPFATPSGGAFTEPQTVSLSSTTPGASITYTLDGTDPTEGSTVYATPFVVSSSVTLRARAFRAGWQPSAVLSYVYTFSFGTLATPTAAPPSGTYGAPQTVVLSAEPGATIRYTLGGAEPTEASPAYAAPIAIASTTTLKARAFRPDWTPSPILTAAYVIETNTEPLPPDPSTVATPINPASITDFAEANAFLYSGPDPIQRGATASAFDTRRLAIVRGRVLDRAGQPLPGARVTILDNPAFGHTLSRLDGLYDIAVNGGGDVVIDVESAGYLPVQRRVATVWHGFGQADDIRLTPLDGAATTVRFDAGGPPQAARGTLVADDAGPRQATVIVPDGGVHANVHLADGTVLPDQAQLTLRATEYTVGVAGPSAMPGQLPVTSGYTYAVELTADEAVQAGAVGVTFDPALVFYVENFLQFPVGGAVPAGSYNRVSAAWMTERNGRVVRVLASDATGAAGLDVDGSGTPASPVVLEALGVTTGERQQLATLYQPGQTLWRVPVPHFSTWDCNWPAGPDDMTAPNVQAPTSDVDTENPTCQGGSIIECENQALGERLPVAGTPFSLNYRSSRQPGRTSFRAVHVTTRRAMVPASLKRIEVHMNVGGQRIVQAFAPDGPESADLLWDGKDAFGRTLVGQQRASVEVRHLYDGFFRVAAAAERSFALRGGAPLGLNVSRGEVFLSSTFELFVGGTDAAGTGTAGLGGWTLDVHHAYDPATATLAYGDGARRTAAALVVRTAAGGGSLPPSAAPQPGTAVSLPPGVSGLIGAADGTVYAQSPNAARVFAFGADGQILERIVPPAPEGYRRSSISVDPDGNLLIAEMTLLQSFLSACSTSSYRAARFFVVRPDGTIQDGTHQAVILPANVCQPSGAIKLAPGKGRSMIGGFGPYLYEFSPGATTLLLTTGSPTSSASYITAIWTDPDGTIYFAANSRVSAIDATGKVTIIAGTGTSGFSGDGGPATLAQVGFVGSIVRDPAGHLVLHDTTSQRRVRRITPDGFIHTVAGAGASFDEGTPAARATLNGQGLAVDRLGDLFVTDNHTTLGGRIRRLQPALATPLGSSFHIASEDGSALFEFDAGGRHLGTRDALVGTVLYTFEDDPAGRLIHITDVDGQITTIERLADGAPSAIVAPFGQRTSLTVSPNGYLAAVADPAGGTTLLTHGEGGLLTGMRTPKGDDYTFSYDGLGRLVEDRDPAGGVQTLSRVAAGLQATVTVAHNAGHDRAHEVTRLASGDEERRTRDADGTVTVTTILANGIRDTLTADGTRQTLQLSPDPRFGMQAPIAASTTITTPGGLAWQSSSTREAILADPQNPLSLTRQTDTTLVNGRTWRQVFDVPTRTLTATTPANRTTTTVFDATGRVSQVTAGSLLPVTFSYTPQGQLATVTQGTRTTTFTYDARGRVERVTDPLAREALFAYDLADRLTSQTLPGGRTVGFGYDAGGNVTAVTPPDRPVHGFSHTPVDLPDRYDPPAATPGGPTTATFRIDRAVQTVTRPDGLTLTLGYDGAGRPETVTTPTSTTTWTYAPTSGLVTSLATPDTTVGIGYDGSLPTSVTWTGAVTGTVGVTYDNFLRPSNQTVNGGATVAFTYDLDNMLTGAGALTITRQPATGLITGTTLSGVSESRTLNGFGEVTARALTRSGSTLYNASYTRDALARIESKTETVGGTTHVEAYTYDAAGRLETVTRDGILSATYGYDTNGNRTSTTTTAGTTTATYDAQDRLQQWSDTSYTYTAAGELLTKSEPGVGTTTYTYDVQGNLRHVALPTGTVIQYEVDALNRRVGRLVNGARTLGWLWAGTLRPVAELDSAGNLVSRFVYGTGINVPDYIVRGGQTYRLITDHLGSVRLVVDVATGAVVQRLDYDGWGRVTLDTSPGWQPFGFAGGLYHPLTGLVRFGARDYDAAVGRWTTKDPLGFGAGPNFYAYVSGNPITRTDPLGLEDGDFLDQMNPFNLQGSLAQTALSIWDALGGMATGDWAQVAAAGATSPLGQTENGPGWAYYGTRASLATSGAAAAGAGYVMAVEGAAAHGFCRVGYKVTERATAPFRTSGHRWYSEMLTRDLISNGARSATREPGFLNWLKMIRYGEKGSGEVVLNWVTRTIVHSNPFF